MNATIIHVDFKNKHKRYTEVVSEVPEAPAGVDVATNKRLINDLKGMLEENIEQLDLYPAVLMIPHPKHDIYVKINGTDINDTDIKALSSIVSKMRQHNVKP